MSEPLPVHVYAIDDDPLVLKFVAAALAGAGLTMDGFSSGEAFFDLPNRADVGCLILDLHLPGMSGPEIQQRLQQSGSDLAVIVVSGKADVATAVQVMRNGAITLLEKPYTVKALLAAVKQGFQLSRESYTHRREVHELQARLDRLTEDERQVLGALVAGATNKQMVKQLMFGARTIERHKSSVFKKMEVGSVAELVSLMSALGR